MLQRKLFLAVLCTLVLGGVPAYAAEDMKENPSITIIAHRGASGERPEHTLASYERAIDLGADFVEPDLVMTKDGVLVCRHENEIGGTTDVSDRPEFADRRVTKIIDGQEMTGWFTEDFTLAELRTLRAKERLPQLRGANSRFDGLWQIPTFAELIALVKAKEAETGRRIGLYPETKHPSYFAGIGLPLEKVLVAQLANAGYRDAVDPVFIQSFEVGNLRALNEMTNLRLVQLLSDEHVPPDKPNLTPALMTSVEGLAAIAEYADAIGPSKHLVIAREDDGHLGATTTLVSDAHAAGLLVHPWTFRAENYFLPKELWNGDNPATHGDVDAEIKLFVAAGVDGVFSDFPGIVVDAVRPAKGD